MGSFFRGWRRKIGTATLLLACVFTFGWIRSQTMTDEIGVLCRTTSYFFLSDDSRIAWSSCSGTYYREHSINHGPWPFSFQTRRSRPREIMNVWSQFDVEWSTQWHGFWYGRSAVRGMRILVVPYWAVVLPLSVVSIYLFLGKRSEEPIAAINVPVEASSSQGGSGIVRAG